MLGASGRIVMIGKRDNVVDEQTGLLVQRDDAAGAHPTQSSCVC